jgi:glycosyltransferase involved in cell wall biosynthesis
MSSTGDRPRVLLTTEGTYPYVLGGVSSWCDLLVNSITEFDWIVLPIIGAHGQPRRFALPAHAREHGPIEVWSERLARGGSADVRAHHALPALLVRDLIGWNGDTQALVASLVWCRLHPAGVRRAFRSARAWDGFLRALGEILAERVGEAGTPPELDQLEAAQLYQTLYWVARTAAAPAPEADVLHVTAAGWSAIPALVNKALHGTPMILTEHGVYVRESYLAAIRNGGSAGSRFAATRLARGLSRCSYAWADVVAPVTDANAYWEMGFGIDPSKILVLYNGLDRASSPVPPPGAGRVVSVGRIDPLKDVHTMLRVAAETLRSVPHAQFLHYGPMTDGEEAYARSCVAMHERLGLGDRFRFMGRTSDPTAVMRAADIVLMTSISEGLPMSILEAMSQARPVISTGVGGVPDVVKGCGAVMAPGDDHGLAMAVVTLVRNPALAWQLGRLGHQRLGRIFSGTACIDGYRGLLRGIAAAPARMMTEEAALR